LSWKSSAIEGNTYSLLETEALLNYNEFSKFRTHEEAIMLINHKHAITHYINNPDFYKELSINKIMHVHNILVNDLNISLDIRKFPVTIGGSNYIPPTTET